MAGLRHNPRAANCAKNETGAGVEGETCDYCARSQSTPASEDARPMVARFLERVGIQHGAHLIDVRTVDGLMLSEAHQIVDIAVLPEPFEAVITLQPVGTKVRHRVVWSKISSYHEL